MDRLGETRRAGTKTTYRSHQHVHMHVWPAMYVSVRAQEIPTTHGLGQYHHTRRRVSSGMQIPISHEAGRTSIVCIVMPTPRA